MENVNSAATLSLALTHAQNLLKALEAAEEGDEEPQQVRNVQMFIELFVHLQMLPAFPKASKEVVQKFVETVQSRIDAASERYGLH